MEIIDSLKQLDTELFLFLNSKHSPFFDTVMSWISARLFWIPFYLLLLYLVFKFTGKRIWLVLLAVALVILISDQVSVHCFKNVFLRYRPCHNVLIQAQVHVNGGCGGQYGFVSSHAANTFALAMFLALFFKHRINFLVWFLFVWAVIVSYSRIYNGVHYPADIAVGGLLGIAAGWAVFQIYQYSYRKIYCT